MIVSADIAVSWRFLSYAMQLQEQGMLQHMMIDKCHLTFTSSNYRLKLAHLKQLRMLKCLMILLTAMLPPILKDELSESMLIQCA